MKFPEVLAITEKRKEELVVADHISDLSRLYYLSKGFSQNRHPQTLDHPMLDQIPFEGMPHRIPKMQLTEWAEEQLFARAGIPRKYMLTLPAKLRDEAVNYSLQLGPNSGKGGLLRSVGKDPICRAVLSDHFQPLDDADLFNLVAPYMEGVEVTVLSQEAHVTHYRCIYENGLDLNGEKHLTGLLITNSEVGYRAVTIQAMIYRPACKNVLPALSGGKRVEDGQDAYLDEDEDQAYRGRRTKSIKHMGSLERIKGRVLAMIEETRYSTELVTAKLKASILKEIGLPIEWLTNYAERERIAPTTLKAILRAYEQEPIPNLYGIVNATTRAAQEFNDFKGFDSPTEQRYQLELTAAEMLDKGLKA